jgi:hypothetical protein
MKHNFFFHFDLVNFLHESNFIQTKFHIYIRDRSNVFRQGSYAQANGT